MKKVIGLSFCLSLLMGLNTAWSQTAADLALAQSLAPQPQPKPNYAYRHGGANEAKELTALLFTGYKFFISSQDQRSCNFHPSCSVYALQTIRKNGLTLGFLDTFDRLSRCHPLARFKYPINPQNGLALDPVL